MPTEPRNFGAAPPRGQSPRSIVDASAMRDKVEGMDELTGPASAIVLEGQKSALELALHGAPLQTVLERLVTTLEAQSDSEVLASILLIDSEGKHLLLGAAPSLPEAYNRAVHGIAIGPSAGSCGTAAFTKQTVVVRDTQSDPLWADFKALAAEHRLLACWSTPIFSSQGAVLGTFALYHRVAREPSERDREIVELLARTAALIIERDLNAELRQRAESQLRAAEAEHEARLRRSWQMVQSLFERAPAVIALIRGPELVIELANSQCLELWQRSSATELVGKPLLEALPEVKGQGFDELLREVMTSRKPFVGNEVPVATRNAMGEASTVILNIVYVPLDNDSGVTDRVGIFAFDVTNGVLARRALEESSRAKDEFLATMSHELRTPLNAIVGWARILQTSSDPKQLERGLETILRNALAQAHLIDDLLDVSRIITGKLKLDVNDVDITEIANAAIDVIRPAAEAKGIVLHTVLDPDAGHVRGDTSRLQQVLWNLLTNAVKFTPKGGRVQVSLRRTDSQVEIVVADNGAGIAQEFLPYVFNRFSQQDANGATRRTGGLGLGLAIVKHLVELHGGTVGARSEGLGRGASFVVQLPIIALRASLPPIRQPASSEQLACPPELANRLVLVVDDEPDSCEVVKMVLEACDAQVLVATSVAQALGLIESGTLPDLIVSDIGMPGEDGYAFMRKLRLLPRERGGRIPAVALTAFARPEDRRNALIAGFQNHAAKPIEPKELLVVLANLAKSYL